MLLKPGITLSQAQSYTVLPQYACCRTQAVLGARESLEGCFEVLQPQLADMGCDWQDFLWAVQVRQQQAAAQQRLGRC
jgi:hypothetical protein